MEDATNAQQTLFSEHTPPPLLLQVVSVFASLSPSSPLPPLSLRPDASPKASRATSSATPLPAPSNSRLLCRPTASVPVVPGPVEVDAGAFVELPSLDGTLGGESAVLVPSTAFVSPFDGFEGAHSVAGTLVGPKPRWYSIVRGSRGETSGEEAAEDDSYWAKAAGVGGSVLLRSMLLELGLEV